VKRKWEVQRTSVKRLDDQRRWEIAYQRLMQWTNEMSAVSEEATASLMTEEDNHESGALCSGFDRPATTDPNH
jgi:hypothetical protein